MIPPKFDYFVPGSMQEALALLATHGEDAKVLAGGQSLLSILKLRLAQPQCLVDLGRIPGLSYIREEGEGRIALGPLTTYAEVRESQLLRDRCPLLPQAAAVVGDVQIRNRGTIGGSLAHADPAADMPAAVLALRGELKIAGPGGERWVRAEEFFQGMFATVLSPQEILAEIRVPALRGQRCAYLKAARRPSDFAVVGVAVCLRVDHGQTCQDIAVGVTGVTDRPYRATGVEEALTGRTLDERALDEAAALVTRDVDVTESLNGSRKYRTHLARVYVHRAIRAAL